MEIIDKSIPDPASVSMRPTAMKFGLVTSLILILIGLLFYVAGLTDFASRDNTWNTIQQWLGNIAAFVVPILAIKYHRDNDLGGYITFGRSLGVGTFTGFFMGMVTFVWILIFFHLIAPDAPEVIKQMAIEQARESGATEEALDAQRPIIEFFTMPVVMGFVGWVLTVVVAFLGSLLGGAIFQKEAPGRV